MNPFKMMQVSTGVFRVISGEPPAFFLRRYALNADGNYEVKITDCIHQQILKHRSKCGKMTVEYRCSLKLIGISLNICDKCKECNDGYTTKQPISVSDAPK